MSKQKVIGVVSAVLLLAAGWLLLVNGKDAVSAAERTKAGILQAEQWNVVYQGMPAAVAELNVEPGAIVKAGDRIATTDASDLELQIQLAEAGLAQASEQQSSQQKQLQLQLEMLERQKSRMSISSQAEGKMVSVMVRKGDFIATGTPVAIVQSERFFLDLYINEEDIDKFREGETIPLTFPVTDERQEGLVKRVSPAPQFASLRMSRERGLSDIAMFQVRVELEQTEEGTLLPGLTAEVDLDELAP